MLKKIRSLDLFTRNFILVFAGTSFSNFLNLIYQLLIAHKLTASDFAAFNSLIAITLLIATPLGTLQLAIAKYAAEFKARGQLKKIKSFLLKCLGKVFILSVITLVLFTFFTPAIINNLKISQYSSGYILALILALAWITPVFAGGVQGIESFKWYMSGSVLSGIGKLILTVILLSLGFGVSGALGAFIGANIILTSILYLPLRSFLRESGEDPGISLKEIVLYALPIIGATVCYNWLTTFDMVLVRYYFSPDESGAYSVAQMVGKIFLFLPGAISIVLFPRASSLKAVQSDTRHILKRSLLIGAGLSIGAFIAYNLFPSLVLKILTGKSIPESIALGRLFSISMTFYALLFIPVNYFLSIKDFKFIKYLVISSAAQFTAIAFFHNTLYQVLVIICINSVLVFLIHLWLAFRHHYEKH
jgi:O-antigen/teichoic acid export membrane protein